MDETNSYEVAQYKTRRNCLKNGCTFEAKYVTDMFSHIEEHLCNEY